MAALLSYFLSFWQRLCCKMSFLVTCEILRLFVNTLTVDDKYSLRNRENLRQTIEMQFSKKQRSFKWYFTGFLKSTSNFEHFEKKKMTLRAPVLPNLRIVKHVVRWIFKIPVSQHSSKMSMIKGPKHCWNLQDRCFIRFFHQFAGGCVVKSLLVISKVVGLFVNILTANGKYSLLLFLLYSIFNVSLQ